MVQINTKADFDQIIEKISSLIEQYENNVVHYNQYQFFLANGEKIAFEMAPQYIGHLLGIRLDYLRSTGLFKNQDSYGLVKEFLKNAYSVYQNIQSGYLSYRSIFSNHLDEKLKIFEKILYYFSPDEIEFVCKYDKSKTFQLGLETDYPCDYFIAKKNQHNDIYILGLIRQSNGYAPMTSMYFPKDETQYSRLKNMLVNQTLTLVISVIIYNKVTNFKCNPYMSVPTKLEKIKNIKGYIGNISGVSIDTSSDYQFNLNGFMMKTNKINAYNAIFQQLIVALQNHTVFSLELVEGCTQREVADEMSQLIDTYNNEVCKDVNTLAQTTYSELLEQYKLLASEVSHLNERLQSADEQSRIYYEQLQLAQRENEQYKAFQKQIFEAVEAQKQKVIAP